MFRLVWPMGFFSHWLSSQSATKETAKTATTHLRLRLRTSHIFAGYRRFGKTGTFTTKVYPARTASLLHIFVWFDSLGHLKPLKGFFFIGPMDLTGGDGIEKKMIKYKNRFKLYYLLFLLNSYTAQKLLLRKLLLSSLPLQLPN